MKNKIGRELKRGFALFSAIFTLATLASSSIQLLQGQPTDTNFHILNRGAVAFIAVTAIVLFTGIQMKNKILSYLVPYALSMGVVFGYVWLTGFVEPLHPDAYRDIFLNFSAVAVLVIAGMEIHERWQARHSQKAQAGRARTL